MKDSEKETQRSFLCYPNTKQGWELAQKVTAAGLEHTQMGMGNETHFIPELSLLDDRLFVGYEAIEEFLKTYATAPASNEPPKSSTS